MKWSIILLFGYFIALITFAPSDSESFSIMASLEAKTCMGMPFFCPKIASASENDFNMCAYDIVAEIRLVQEEERCHDGIIFLKALRGNGRFTYPNLTDMYYAYNGLSIVINPQCDAYRLLRDKKVFCLLTQQTKLVREDIYVYYLFADSEIVLIEGGCGRSECNSTAQSGTTPIIPVL